MDIIIVSHGRQLDVEVVEVEFTDPEKPDLRRDQRRPLFGGPVSTD